MAYPKSERGFDAPNKDKSATLDENPGFPTRAGSLNSKVVSNALEMNDSMTLAEILGFRSRNGSSKKKNVVKEGLGGIPEKKRKKKRMKKARERDLSGSNENGSGALKIGFSASEGEIARVFNAPEEEGKNKSFPQPSFKKGDIVWAKAFPYTYWPGWIDLINGPVASVSFFGCSKTQRFQVSEIHGFEENYAQMSKMIGVKLSYEIDLALEELSRRMLLGLMCSCRNPSLEAIAVSYDQIAGVKRGLEPSEMLGFVLDIAVSAWVCDAKTVCAVKLSALVNSYRHFVSVCQTSEVDEGFCPSDILDFVLNMAVCLCCNDEETASVGKEVAQLNAYRRFVSIRPNWVYQRDSLLSEESEASHQKKSDCSSESEMVYGVIREPEGDVSGETQEEDREVFQEQTQEGRDMCVISRADFTILDLDEENESLMNDPLEAVANGSGSAREDDYINENLRMQNLCTDSSSKELVVDVEVACNKSFSHVRDVNEKSLLLAKVDNLVMKIHSSTCNEVVSYRSNEEGDNMNGCCSLTSPKCASRSTSDQKKGRNQRIASDLSEWRRLYASPLIRDGSKSPSKAGKLPVTERFSNFPTSLHMKFPKDFTLPSKQLLEKKFGVFGPLDRSRTKVFFYTGAGQVVFLCQADAYAAYKYVKRKNVFGQANVRFWLDKYEYYRKRTPVLSMMGRPSSNLKSCLKRPTALPEKDEKKKCGVRFSTENQLNSVSTKVP